MDGGKVMILAAAAVIMIVTVTVLIACYKTTIISMEANGFHLKNHKDNI
jgi:predicted permease